jgi:hypothetical protein
LNVVVTSLPSVITGANDADRVIIVRRKIEENKLAVRVGFRLAADPLVAEQLDRRSCEETSLVLSHASAEITGVKVRRT